MKYTTMLQLVSFLASGTLSTAYVANIPPPWAAGGNPLPPAPGGYLPPPAPGGYLPPPAPGGAPPVIPGVPTSELVSPSYGSIGPPEFNDGNMIPSNAKLQSIGFHVGERTHGIFFKIDTPHTFFHGGEGGKLVSLDIGKGDYVKAVDLCWGDAKGPGTTRIHYMKVLTKDERSLEAGTKGANLVCGTAAAPEGYGVVGSFGRAAREIDQIGFIYRPFI